MIRFPQSGSGMETSPGWEERLGGVVSARCLGKC